MRRQKLAFEASSPSFLLSSSPLSPCFFSSSSREHTLHSARRVRTRRKEKLAQRDSCGTLHFTMAKILCKATALARATTHAHTHTHALSFSLKRRSKFLDFTVHAFVNCFREWFSYILVIVVPRLFLS